jgi:hypothetical protein
MLAFLGAILWRLAGNEGTRDCFHDSASSDGRSPKTTGPMGVLSCSTFGSARFIGYPTLLFVVVSASTRATAKQVNRKTGLPATT